MRGEDQTKQTSNIQHRTPNVERDDKVGRILWMSRSSPDGSAETPRPTSESLSHPVGLYPRLQHQNVPEPVMPVGEVGGAIRGEKERTVAEEAVARAVKVVSEREGVTDGPPREGHDGAHEDVLEEHGGLVHLAHADHKIGKFTDSQSEFLEFHRSKIFRG